MSCVISSSEIVAQELFFPLSDREEITPLNFLPWPTDDGQVNQSFLQEVWSRPDWSDKTSQAPGSLNSQIRSNIYRLPDYALKAIQHNGRIHAQRYPVEVTGLLIPFHPLQNFLDGDSNNPLRKIANDFAGKVFGWRSMEDLYNWLGLNNQPTFEQQKLDRNLELQPIPYPEGERNLFPMGATLIERGRAVGLTFGCAECHTANLFGRKVFGLTNRFPRANRFFTLGRKAAPLIPDLAFRIGGKATKEETEITSGSPTVNTGETNTHPFASVIVPI